MKKTIGPKESQHGRNTEIKSQILIQPMTVFTTALVPVETSTMEK